MSAGEHRRLKRIRLSVIARDGLTCIYCGKELPEKEVTMDHILPGSLRGTFNKSNLTVSCIKCNNKRGSKPFFEYIVQFSFSEEKILKYKRFYYNNLKIKVLNIAKEELLLDKVAVPQDLINEACTKLRIRTISFENMEPLVAIKFGELTPRKKIKLNFENLIRIIDSEDTVIVDVADKLLENKMIKPLWDQVLVERAVAETVTPSGIFIPTTVQEKSQEVFVRAVGQGRLLQDGTVVAPAVKVGAKVLLAKHPFTEVKVDGRDMLIVREDAILAVLQDAE